MQRIRKHLNYRPNVGFVPTLGGLHEGHLSLSYQSMADNDITVMSIFCNPMQFNDINDLTSYPSDISQDIKYAEQAGVDILFTPNVNEIYKDDMAYYVDASRKIATVFEGEFRPGHFRGLLTVLIRLFMIVMPNRAYFGMKDYQQYLLVRDMVQAMFFNIDIIGCPTIRNADGLPLSSRNKRLSIAGLRDAARFSRLLASNQDNETIKGILIKDGFLVQYIGEIDSRRFGAVVIEGVRIIDNVDINTIAS